MTKRFYERSYTECLQDRYGTTFEEMTKREKLFLVSFLAAQLIDTTTGKCRNEIYVVGHELLDELSTREVESLIETIISQIRWGRHAETTT